MLFSAGKFHLFCYQTNLRTVVPCSALLTAILTKMLAFFLLLLGLSGWPKEKQMAAILPAAVPTERLVAFQMGRIACLNLLTY